MWRTQWAVGVSTILLPIGGDLCQPLPVSLTKPSPHSHKLHRSESAECGRLDLLEEVNSESFYRICMTQIASRSLLTLPKTQQHANMAPQCAMFYART